MLKCTSQSATERTFEATAQNASLCRRFWRCGVVAALAAAIEVLFNSSPLLAKPTNDVAAASELFHQGLSDMLAGNFDTACHRLEESQHLDPQLGTLFTLAECDAKAGKIASAVAYYEDFLAATAKLPQASMAPYDRRIRIAKSRCSSLKPDVLGLR